MKDFKKKGFDCKDCGIDTSIKDYYMVSHKIWNKYGLGGSKELRGGGWKYIGKGKKSGMLCIDCLEKRMGRKLEYEDLLPGTEFLNNYTYSIFREKYS